MNNTIPIKELRKEIAYHEASHFILGLLVNKENNHFKQPTNITFCVKEKEKFLANVCVPNPFVDENESISGYNRVMKAQEFYSKEEPRVYLKCLELLAGFVSCKIFMNKPDKFIHYLRFCPETILSSDVSVDYLDCSSFWYGDYFIKADNRHDFRQVNTRLSNLDLDWDQKYGLINIIIEQLCLIMSAEKIKQSIESVAQKLIEKECATIELDEIEEIKKEVLSIIGNFKLTQYLNKIEHAKKQLPANKYESYFGGQ